MSFQVTTFRLALMSPDVTFMDLLKKISVLYAQRGCTEYAVRTGKEIFCTVIEHFNKKKSDSGRK